MASTTPGADAARNASGEIELTVMNASHAAFRRDLVRLAQTASRSNLADPARVLAINNGWSVFKRQLLQHHEQEDEFLWPALLESIGDNTFALSTLQEMEAEHALIDPLLSAVDETFGDAAATEERLADVIDALVTTLTSHLGHEERDALPLIGSYLTVEQWMGILGKIRAKGTLDEAMEMVPWVLENVSPEQTEEVLGTFPPVVREMYATAWKPKYDAVPHW